MTTSLDLLKIARERHPELSERALSMQLGHSPETLRQARLHGNLSPGLAMDLAAFLQAQDPAPWIALAGLEATKPSRLRDAMIRKLVANLRI